MDRFVDQLAAEVANFIPKFGLGAAVFLVFLVAVFISDRLIIHFQIKVPVNKRFVLLLIGQFLRFTLVTLGLISALGTMGINVSALVAGLGLTGFALGFALRDAISNMLAGILILFYHPFRLGDYVTVTGLEGSVINIDLRYTTLQLDQKIILIPNQNMFTNPILITTRQPVTK